MPELPEVETVRRGLAGVMTGRRLAGVDQYRADLRFPLPADLPARLAGRRVLELRRRAKYLLIDLDGAELDGAERDGAGLDGRETLILHLGMSGRLLIRPLETPRLPHDHVVFRLEGGPAIAFNDARRFGSLDLVATDLVPQHRLLAGLGPEPFDPALDGAGLAAALAGRLSPLKAALLDQKTIAGLGNIYVCEALFRARLSPKRLAATVTGARADRLLAAIRGVLTDAIAAGGSTLRDYVQSNGELGYFQHSFAVYDREGLACPGCTCGAPHRPPEGADVLSPQGPAAPGTPLRASALAARNSAAASRKTRETAPPIGVRRIVQSGRSTFYCPRHQR